MILFEPHPQMRAILLARLADPHLLGGLLDGPSWRYWRALLIAAMGEGLTDDERALFREITARDREPGQRVEELWGIIGRRGGKNHGAHRRGACRQLHRAI